MAIFICAFLPFYRSYNKSTVSLYWVPFGQPSKIGSLEPLYHVKGDWFLTMFLTTHKPTRITRPQNQLQNNKFAEC